jgi:cytochrome P450
MLSRWEAGRAFEVLPAVERLTMEVIARYLFGTDLGADGPAIRNDLALIGRWFPLLSLPGGRRIERFPLVRSASTALARFDATIYRRVAESQGQSSCLARMAGSLEPAAVRDHVVTMFLAGFDTTAASLAWTLHLLSTHPPVAQRVHDDPAFADKVVQESLRLFPPIVRMGRRALDDMVIGGRFVARGSVVFVSPYVTQRDPRWFPDPDRFDPDRWLDPSFAPPPFAYFPFGMGSRACIGEHLARRVLTAAVASIVQQWRLLPVATDVIRGRSFLTLKPERGFRLVPVPWL